MSKLPPEIWSDIDGTALEKLSARNPRHWYRNARKRNLAGLEGYLDFLRGAQSEGAEVAGMASKRAEWMRRRTTLRSISQLGLTEFFGGSAGRVVLAGGEKAKARFIGDRSRDRVVGMLEDQPQNFVDSLVLYGLSEQARDNGAHHPILVGVVAHDSSSARIERLRSNLGSYGAIEVRDEPGTNTGLTIFSDTITVHVTQLEPYSQEEGARFGQRLADLAAA